MKSEIKSPLICSDCIGDTYLKSLFDKDANQAICNFCDSEKQCMHLITISRHILQVLLDCLAPGEDKPYYDIYGTKQWRTTGRTILDIVQDTAGVENEVAQSIVNEVVRIAADSYALTRVHSWYIADDENYEVDVSTADNTTRNWDMYAQQIKHSYRFYIPEEFDFLPKLFCKFRSMKAQNGESILRTLECGDKSNPIFRGRPIESDEDIFKAWKEPEDFFGPPPEDKAIAGRMNPLGVPYLYCASSRDTCVAELRAPVGSRVATVQLEILRPLTVIDLPSLDSGLMSSVGFYHPEYPNELALLNFLNQFHHRISQPVLPDNEIEYIPTQSVAEFFAHRFKPEVDGLIYSSCQGTDLASNLVFFHRASRIDEHAKRSVLPPKFSVSIGKDYCIIKEHDEEEMKKLSSARCKGRLFMKSVWDDINPPAFKVIEQSVRIHKIQSIRHQSSTIGINRADDISHRNSPH